ncbi:isoprenyl transferase [Brumimicrobium aurantiacum]|uniref:Isoprenyl transferase n=1 Tax=Brumimicrobium aurantiacum TaxID=1737063 RepID=A0A3E1EYB8_9FLAO|nr:isoprenyl transferase [Brumimicrobium aurantiacum]RFC54527.1 isoprenyl transferase [Brumimicrobium aurantiacum]
MSLLNKINLEKCPQHIAIIMDGNGRWAKQQGEVRLFGHSYGVEAVREVLKACVDAGVRHLTLYAFSTENWNRPQEEVDGLMNLMVETIANEVEELDDNNIRLRSIGDKNRLPNACRNELNAAMEATKTNDSLDLILALNYSARWEIVDAVKKIANKVKEGKINPEEIDDDTFSNELCINDVPDPELLIRTSGECRISNFMLWQIAYSELYFTDILWPDFKRENLFEAIIAYQNRERRFGQVSEQLKN